MVPTLVENYKPYFVNNLLTSKLKHSDSDGAVCSSYISYRLKVKYPLCSTPIMLCSQLGSIHYITRLKATLNKDKKDKKEDTGISIKNELYILRNAKRRLLS